MKLSVKALSGVCGLVWGGAVLSVGLANLAAPSYGKSFLRGMSSVYPGFHASRKLSDVLVGTGYALLDGAVGGFVFGRLYNSLARR